MLHHPAGGARAATHAVTEVRPHSYVRELCTRGGSSGAPLLRRGGGGDEWEVVAIHRMRPSSTAPRRGVLASRSPARARCS